MSQMRTNEGDLGLGGETELSSSVAFHYYYGQSPVIFQAEKGENNRSLVTLEGCWGVRFSMKIASPLKWEFGWKLHQKQDYPHLPSIFNYLNVLFTRCQVFNYKKKKKILAQKFLSPVRKQHSGAEEQGCTWAASRTTLTAVLVLQQLPVT